MKTSEEIDARLAYNLAIDKGKDLVDKRYGLENDADIIASPVSFYNLQKELCIPKFQRYVTWDHEKQVAFCKSVLSSIPLPGFVIWERGRKEWVVDGQQRLTSLGVRFVRGEEKQQQCKAYTDFDGNWYDEPSEDRWSLMQIAYPQNDRQFFKIFRNDIVQMSYWSYLQDRLRRFSFPSVIIRNATSEIVKRIFVTMTIPGVQISKEEAERWASMDEE